MADLLHDADFSAEIAPRPAFLPSKCDKKAINKCIRKTFYIMLRVAKQARAIGPISDFSAEIGRQDNKEGAYDSESRHGF